ncbi:MAG: N-acetylmuramic acid 6-phosphate etherase, partial [Chitinophagaceae bacterium]|nr:N-acetylmuramic acid 6-phosphate etherase [Chitinophagaceae bacterium]
MAFEKLTEQDSPYRHLEKMSVRTLLDNINKEDQTVPAAVQAAIPQIEKLTEVVSDKMLMGGRLFYIGAGTSGRLAVVDASECPPTYGVPYGLVIAVIAGGDKAITTAIEFAEDDREQGWKDLQAYNVSDKDVVIGIAASGTSGLATSGFLVSVPSGSMNGAARANVLRPLSLGKSADLSFGTIAPPTTGTGTVTFSAADASLGVTGTGAKVLASPAASQRYAVNIGAGCDYY